MPPQTQPATHPDQIRERILGVAQARFMSFGYGKTTMAEIASDCGMSAANIYRFFEHKQAIAVALTRTHLAVVENEQVKTVSDTSLSCEARLLELVLIKLRHLHSCWAEMPRFHELVDDVCGAHSEVISQHINVQHSLIRGLLEEGQDTGEFKLQDTENTTIAFETAVKLFFLPNCMEMFELKEFQRRAALVVAALVHGIKGV